MADRIRDVMTSNPQTLSASATVREAAETMRANDIGDVIASDDKGGIAGIVTDRDIVVRVVAESPAGGQAGQGCRHRQHRRPGGRARPGIGAGRYLRRPAQHLGSAQREVEGLEGGTYEILEIHRDRHSHNRNPCGGCLGGPALQGGYGFL